MRPLYASPPTAPAGFLRTIRGLWGCSQRGKHPLTRGNVLNSVVPGERRPVGVALLQECVTPLDSLVGHVGKAGGLPGEHLLADEPVVDEVEGVLQHALRGGRLRVDLPAPVESDPLQVSMGYDGVDHAHPVRFIGGVLVAEEEDLACELLADLSSEVRRPEAAVERADIGIGLLEAGVRGRNALRTSGRSNAIRTVPWSMARW